MQFLFSKCLNHLYEKLCTASILSFVNSTVHLQLNRKWEYASQIEFIQIDSKRLSLNSFTSTLFRSFSLPHARLIRWLIIYVHRICHRHTRNICAFCIFRSTPYRCAFGWCTEFKSDVNTYICSYAYLWCRF